MQLRAAEAADSGWQPIYERLALDWIDRGCGRAIDHRPRPVESMQWVRRRWSGRRSPNPRRPTRMGSSGCSERLSPSPMPALHATVQTASYDMASM
ncbi:MAG: hypothetical protein IPG77_10970 [Betaproteobacteria bacterium]|nr:hypothetical protein [Betaproteobacteria bacterium]